MAWYYIIWCRDDSSLPWRKSHFNFFYNHTHKHFGSWVTHDGSGKILQYTPPLFITSILMVFGTNCSNCFEITVIWHSALTPTEFQGISTPIHVVYEISSENCIHVVTQYTNDISIHQYSVKQGWCWQRTKENNTFLFCETSFSIAKNATITPVPCESIQH